MLLIIKKSLTWGDVITFQELREVQRFKINKVKIIEGVHAYLCNYFLLPS